MTLASKIREHRLRLASRHSWFEGLLTVVCATATFLLLSGSFFALLGRAPLPLLGEILRGAFGSWYGTAETLVKTTPILLCALATALPAR